MCPKSHWFNDTKTKERRANGYMCRLNLTEDNCFIYFVKLSKAGKITAISKAVNITEIASGESFRAVNDFWRHSSFAWDKTMLDITTITYRDADGKPTGTLKIITSPYEFKDISKESIGTEIGIDENLSITHESMIDALLTQPKKKVKRTVDGVE